MLTLLRRWKTGVGAMGLPLLLGSLQAQPAAAAVRLINQVAVTLGGVTPGDAPGFPVTISRPGSYELSSNLLLPNLPGTKGIVVTAEGVEINLNGFAIIGPRTCPNENEYLGCLPAAEDPTYVLIVGGRNVTVKNGTVRGSLGHAILLGAHARLENLNILWNSLFGVSVCQEGATLTNSVLAQNMQGAFLGEDCIVTGNRFRVNPFAGLQMTGPNCGFAGNVLDCTGANCVMGGVQTGVNVCGGSPCP
jgi:hypothetical protein